MLWSSISKTKIQKKNLFTKNLPEQTSLQANTLNLGGRVFTSDPTLGALSGSGKGKLELSPFTWMLVVGCPLSTLRSSCAFFSADLGSDGPLMTVLPLAPPTAPAGCACCPTTDGAGLFKRNIKYNLSLILALETQQKYLPIDAGMAYTYMPCPLWF